MNEEFLHYVWQFQVFDSHKLVGTKSEPIVVINPGNLNRDAGPDFLNAHLRISNLDWHGHIEIHHKSSDWLSHNHHTDQAYDSVILHVVWTDNKEIIQADGTRLSTLEIKNITDPNFVERYKNFISSHDPILCHSHINQVNEIVKMSMLDKALTERLISKGEAANKLLTQNKGSWEETLYQLIGKNFGHKINSEAFLSLCQSVPLKILRRLPNLASKEAVLFGLAGFLDDPAHFDSYYDQLKTEFEYLRHKHNLKSPLKRSNWKFLRLRPANFPTIRIAQFAAFIHNTPNYFSNLKSMLPYKRLIETINVQASGYWSVHYDFGKGSSRKLSKKLGKSAIENLVINTMAPMLWLYGSSLDDQAFKDQAIRYLEETSQENNRITRHWKGLIDPQNAFESQALIELYNSYCSKKRCLACNIGNQILKQK